jgi:hypothetical protein
MRGQRRCGRGAGEAGAENDVMGTDNGRVQGRDVHRFRYATMVRESKRMREGNFLKRVHRTVAQGGKVNIIPERDST